MEELVPHDHFYRHVERTLDLAFVRELVEKTYAGGGRPSIDPSVFFKLQLVLFFEGLRSERQLMRHAADRLSVRWFVGYDLGETLPDHSSLTRIRERYGLEVFRRFFAAIVEQCQAAGLVWGREVYIDGTKVAANAGKESVKPRFAVEAHLSSLFDMETEEPVEEREQLKAQEEPTSNEHEELSARSPLRVMSTSVRQTKSCISLLGIRQSVRCAIGHAPGTVIIARSNPSVPPASKDAASAGVSMNLAWNECAPISTPSHTRKPYGNGRSG